MPGGGGDASPDADAIALIRACAAGDTEGIKVILDHADLRDVAETLAGMVHGLMLDYAAVCGLASPAEAVDEYLRAALAAGRT